MPTTLSFFIYGYVAMVILSDLLLILAEGSETVYEIIQKTMKVETVIVATWVISIIIGMYLAMRYPLSSLMIILSTLAIVAFVRNNRKH